MPKRVQIRRGNQAGNESFAGAVGELTYDNTLDTIRAHDGSTLGGRMLSRLDQSVKYVDTISDLESETEYTGLRKVRGYHSSNGGMESPTYYHDSNDTTTPTDKATILAAADGGRWKRLKDRVEVNVKEFGARGDVTGFANGTDDTQAFKDAIAAIRAIIADKGWDTDIPQIVLYIPEGRYLISDTLFVGADNGAANPDLEIGGIVGAGTAEIAWNTTATKPIIDVTGGRNMLFENFQIVSYDSGAADIGILLARNSSGNSAGSHLFRNVNIRGNYNVAAVYNYSSELCRFEKCIIKNKQNQPCAILTKDNSIAVTSEGTTIHSGAISALYGSFSDCEFHHDSGSFPTTKGAVEIEASNGVVFQRCYFVLDNTAGHFILAKPDGAGNAVECLVLQGNTFHKDPETYITFDGATVTEFSYKDNKEGAATVAAIRGINSVTINNSVIETSQEVNITGDMQSAFVTSRGKVIVSGTFSGFGVIRDINNSSFGTRNAPLVLSSVGRILMPNDEPLQWEDSGGVFRNILEMDVNDNVLIENPTPGNHVRLIANGNVLVGIGNGVFKVQNGTNVMIESDAANNTLGFYGVTMVSQPSSTGEALGFTAGTGTGVNDDSTFTGNVGAIAYNLNDVVKHLKRLGILAQ